MNSNFCLIIPAYNEEKRLNIDQFLSFLTQNKHAALLFVNDGSIDNTALVLNKIKALNPDQVAILSLKNNVGKAESVRQGYLFALKKNFSFIGFFDADLSTPLNESLRMLESFNQNSQIEYVFGSRIARMGSNINRKGYRHYLGRIIATFIDTYLRLSVYDTQCGAKLMRKELATVIFEQPFVSKWLFDVEILARIIIRHKRKKAKQICLEMPLLSWQHIEGSKITFFDTLKIPLELFRVFFYSSYKINS